MGCHHILEMHCLQHPHPPPALATGSYEVWRPDVSNLPASVLGKNLSDWAGERWWDIRSSEVRSLMQSRLDLCKSKGFDAADPDNVNAYLQVSSCLLPASCGLAASCVQYAASPAHAVQGAASQSPQPCTGWHQEAHAEEVHCAMQRPLWLACR